MGDVIKETYHKRVVANFSRRLDQMIAANEVTDFSDTAEQATVNAVVDAVYAANRINDRVGAFYTTDRVREVLGHVSRQAVSERVKNHRLLRVQTADGKTLFPAFQFSDGTVLPGLQMLLKILLDSGVDGWTVTYWLTARIPQLGQSTALEVLSSNDADRIARLKSIAADDAAGWRAAA